VRCIQTLLVLALALVALSLTACGGDDDEGTTTTPAPSEAPNGGATPPSAGGLPPGIAECIADQGLDLESPDELHSVPDGVLQACFQALHQGGAAP
jgi:hypothetical protein